MRRVERWAAGLSLAAGGIHAGAAPGHFAEWWGYGLFFVAAALAQVVYGLLLATRGVEPGRGPSWPQVRRPIYAAGIAGNLAIMVLWLVTRTVGIPWFGPEAGVVETVGVLDGVSKAVEAALVLVLAWLMRAAHAAPSA